jgi:hypothetical protein
MSQRRSNQNENENRSLIDRESEIISENERISLLESSQRSKKSTKFRFAVS